MMNREYPSSKLSCLKYMIIIPIISLLSIIFNSPLFDDVTPNAIKAIKQFTDGFDFPEFDNSGPQKANIHIRSNSSWHPKRLTDDKLTKEAANEADLPPASVNPDIPNYEIPPGAHWHAEMTGGAIVNISGGQITIDGENGIALIKNRDRHPSVFIIKKYPDAIFFYKGKEYPLNEFQDIVPVEKIRETYVYLGIYSTRKFGDANKKCVIIFEFAG